MVFFIELQRETAGSNCLQVAKQRAGRGRKQLTYAALISTLNVMEVQFSPEQEAKLSQIANHNGTDATQLVKDAALRLLDEEEQFHAAIREGIAAADRGEFIEHGEVWDRVEKVLRG
jgi:predicted transcriptional regulator